MWCWLMDVGEASAAFKSILENMQQQLEEVAQR